MIETLTFLFSGMILGLTAGISPGPLLTLVVSETLRTNRTAGIRVAIAPLVTDIPIVIVTFIILSRLSDFDFAVGLISVLGSAFIGYLAYENIFTKNVEFDIREFKSHSLRKGIITNFLNPHPYLFWFTAGVPTVLKAICTGVYSAAAFVSGFYVFLIGSKILVVIITAQYSSFLTSRAYIYIIRVLGGILLLFALVFLRDGLRLLLLIPYSLH